MTGAQLAAALVAVAAAFAPLRPAAQPPAPIPEGDASRTLVAGSERIEVHTYRPPHYRDGAMLIVLPGGVARSALAFRAYARPLADAHGYLLVVPQFEFDRIPFWRYQWAGIARRLFRDDDPHLEAQPRGQRLDALLRPLIEEVRRSVGAPGLPYALLGHGDGGEAALRWAAFEPNDARFVAVAEPAAWLFPTRRLLFPDGFGGLPPELAGETRLRSFLSQSVLLLSGLDEEGRPTPAGERARNAWRAAQQAARDRNRPSHWRLIEVPRGADNARALFASPQVRQALAPHRGD